MKDINFIIKTSETPGPTSDLKSGWILIDMNYHKIKSYQETETIVVADMLSHFNFTTFSINSFSDFETDILSKTALCQNDIFPIGTYGINLIDAPLSILGTSTLTAIQKSVIVLAVSC